MPTSAAACDGFQGWHRGPPCPNTSLAASISNSRFSSASERGLRGRFSLFQNLLLITEDASV